MNNITPLPELTFYRLPDVSPSAATIDKFLDAVYGSLTSATDYRGVTIPSTHTWTWQRFRNASTITEAVYNTTVPSTASLTKNPTFIFAGSSSTASPTMLTPDTSFTLNTPHIGIVLNPGSYSDWKGAAPMTSGSFSGYWYAASSQVNLTTAIVRPFVSQENILLQFYSTNTLQYMCQLGAFIQPSNTYDETKHLYIPAAESDNRLYGMSTIGATVGTGLGSTHLRGSNFYLYQGALSIAQAHTGYFIPGLSTFTNGVRRHTVHAGPQLFENIDINGNYFFEKMYFTRNNSSLGQYSIGYSREVYGFGVAQAGLKTIKSGSTDLYHILSSDDTTSAEALALKAAP
jgi:hypothetical protein